MIHMHLLYYWKGTIIGLMIFRNPRNINWDKYRECLKQSLEDFSSSLQLWVSPSLLTADLCACIERLERVIIQAYYNSCLEKTHRGVGKTPCWIPKLDKIQTQGRKALNGSKKTRKAKVIYKQLTRDYKVLIQKERKGG